MIEPGLTAFTRIPVGRQLTPECHGEVDLGRLGRVVLRRSGASRSRVTPTVSRSPTLAHMRGTNTHNLPDSGSMSFKSQLSILVAIGVTVFSAVILAVVLSCAGYYFLLRPSTRLVGTDYRDLVEVVKIALAVVAGIGGTAALTVAVRKQKVAERQRELSEADANRQDRRMLHERFQNAVEMLGKKESAAVRIGGAYSLENWPMTGRRSARHASTSSVDTCVFRMICQVAPMVREKFGRLSSALCASIYWKTSMSPGTGIYSTLAVQSLTISISVASV